MHYERVSLARRGGSWRMSYRAVYDAEHKGDRKWATIGAAANRAEAEHLAAEYLYNLPRDPEDERRAAAIEATVGHMPTVGELRQDDIDHALSVGAIEKSTYTGYCQHVRRLGDLGEIPVDRVTAQDVQLYIDSLVEDGYCSETVNLMLWTVRETLELASFRMLRPPLDLRRIRAPKHDRPLPRALSAEEKNALLAALPCIHGPLDAIVRLALFAGLRCGEICGLRWTLPRCRRPVHGRHLRRRRHRRRVHGAEICQPAVQDIRADVQHRRRKVRPAPPAAHLRHRAHHVRGQP